MLMSAEPAAVSRVQCRQIVERDLDVLADKLTSGFSVHTREFWIKGLARIAERPAIEHMPRFGYLLDASSGPVGLILTISSRRGRQVICNLSSWYVDRPYRRPHAASLPVTATSMEGPLYLNTSPADHTRRSMTSMGWIQYNFGRSVAFPALTWGAGKVSETIPEDLPERDLLEDHRAWGCVSVVCARGDAVSPFVFRPRRITRLNLPIGYPSGIENLESVITKLERRAPPGFAAHASALLLAVLNLLWHQHKINLFLASGPPSGSLR